MIITWDEPKRVINIQRHALDFRDLDDLFFVRANIGTEKKVACVRLAAWLTAL